MSGFKENQDVVSQVYDNLEGIQNPNKPPNAPYLLDDSNIKDNKVVLTWTPPIDPENSSGSYTPESDFDTRYKLDQKMKIINIPLALDTMELMKLVPLQSLRKP